MSAKYVLGGVGNIQFLDKATGESVITSKTLVESGIEFAISSEEVRGGLANKLLARYFHDSAMNLTLTDALFNLHYLAQSTGGTIEVGGDVMYSEQITTTVANTITPTYTPQKFLNVGTILWWSLPSDDDWTVANVTDGSATVDGIPVGTTVCVKYIKTDATIEKFIVSAAFIPNQCYALLTLPLFKSGTDTQSFTQSSKVGEIQVEIPTFLFDGSQSLSLSSSGVAQASLSGSALATFDGSEGCDGDGYYAILKQIIFNKDEWADVKTIVVADSDIDLIVDGTQTIQVYAMYGNGIAPKLVDNSKLTFTSSDDTIAEVSSAGVVTAKAQGNAAIEIKVTSKPALTAYAYVQVTTE